MYDSLEYHVVDALATMSQKLGRAEARIEELEAEREAEFARNVAREGAKMEAAEQDVWEGLRRRHWEPEEI